MRVRAGVVTRDVGELDAPALTDEEPRHVNLERDAVAVAAVAVERDAVAARVELRGLNSEALTRPQLHARSTIPSPSSTSK